MRPICLEIENLRSFRSKRILDFSNLGIFAIIGATGVGKTSILEAMTYALFNRPTYDGRAVRHLIAKGARSMSVKFTFSIDGDVFTVERITRQNGPAQARLSCEARGIAIQQADNVTNAITRALCMDDEAFLHTVLLPQGLHARLLTSTQGIRNDILAELFNLSRLPVVEGYVRSLEARVGATLAEIDVQRRRFGDDPAAEVSRAADELKLNEANAAKARAAAERVSALDEQLRKGVSTLAQHEEDEQILARATEASQGLARISQIETALRPERDEAANRYQAQHDAVEEATKQRDDLRNSGSDLDSLQTVSQLLERASLALKELDADRGLIAEQTTRVASQREQAQAASATVASKRRERDGVGGEMEKQKAEVADLGARTDQLRNAMRTWTAARQQADEAAAAVSSAEAAAGKIEPKVARLREKLTAAQSDIEVRRAAYELARLADQAADVGAHLHPGDDCPVCRRPLPKNYTAPTNPDLQKAKRIFDSATQAERTIRREEEDAQAAFIAAKAKVDQLRPAAARAQKGAADAEAAAATLLGDQWKEPEKGLSLLVTSLDVVLTAQRDLERELSKCDAALLAAERAEAAATASFAAAEEARARAETAAAGHEAALNAAIGAIPTAFRPQPKVEFVATAVSRVAQAMQIAREVADRLAAAMKAYAEAAEVVHAVERRLTRDVTVPRARFTEMLAPIAQLLKIKARPKADAAVIAWCQDVCTKADDRRQQLARESTGLRAQAESLRATRASVVADVGGEPVELAQQFAIHVVQAKSVLDQARENQRLSQENLQREGSFRTVSAGLSGLRTALRASEFPAYATRERQQRLLHEGTLILGSMTGGQFGFAEDFDIRDEFTQQRRSADTLSGGEKFLASLALSLAAVEVASNAGNKIESIFLDEGFDSLDPDVLSRAMMQLRDRATKGRMICVISHVSQVTEFVNATIVVQKTDEGTDFRRVDGPLDDDPTIAEGLITHLTSV